MAFGSFDNKTHNAPMAEINMVPLIDVLLVLLVIFIVTAPLLTHAVKLDLPSASAAPNESVADKVQFAIDAEGIYYWNGEVLSREDAQRRFEEAAQVQPQPEIHLRADENVAYKFVAQTLADASSAGLTKVGFITQPDTK